MSGDINRQLSHMSEASSVGSDGNSSEEMDEDIDHSYYEDTSDDLGLDCPSKTDDPEYFEYEPLQLIDAEKMLNEEIEALCTKLKVNPSMAKMLLLRHNWNKEEIIDNYQRNPTEYLIESHLASRHRHDNLMGHRPLCSVCCVEYSKDRFMGVACGHLFCRDCWDMHFQIQIQDGITTGIECMAKECPVLVTEDFVCEILSHPKLRDKYSKFSFNDLIKSHPNLRFCPGVDCSVIIKAKEPKAKKVECQSCKATFCFKCGIAYHAPTECDVIKRWLTKCEDDSETANYISAHTKDCPKCHVCIEKNGGCNHMQCPECKYDFCWMCLGDWKSHGSEYYECSRYKENPNIANESVHVQAREALKKYLFYYERWENHAKSLQLEETTTAKITTRTQEKVMNNQGTWIDWQYLLRAAGLLKKAGLLVFQWSKGLGICRYTLQYTYPYAYYMEKGPRKILFEYQQAQLEAEVENLSWKVERAEITDRGVLENQMDVAEKRRLTLLKEFLDVQVL
ncbi:protein ariadne-2 [Biomphalaria pfeifferi]|uniref:RBR-type E3 ubiquitin transferase n=1 Tax=Biomphalaria pfeifferi TaxID=112525 RepID=A0AAD8B9G8_BIOPF|nr:protein ariadne-2 [Biomphalaria pfeifferi]